MVPDKTKTLHEIGNKAILTLSFILTCIFEDFFKVIIDPTNYTFIRDLNQLHIDNIENIQLYLYSGF